MSAVVYCGSMGDWPLLTDAQRMEGVERLVDAGLPVIAGTGAVNTASAVALHDLQVNWLNPAEHRVLGVFVPVIEHLTRRNWGDDGPPTHTGLRDVALFATAADTLLREARDDENVKALVLRVDSPGGEVFASEQIRREIVGRADLDDRGSH